MAIAPKNWLNGSETTTLTADVASTSATTITVASAASFPSVGTFRIKVDTEKMDVTGGQGTTTWTVTRGVDGTTAATHTSGALVTGWTPLDEVGLIDLEARMGAYTDSVRTAINAKTSPYGAVGNGTTDDRAAIQAAIDAAFAAGGGVVFLPPGSYNIASSPGLTLKAGVTLMGAGKRATTLKQGFWPGIFSGFISAAGTFTNSNATTLSANGNAGSTTVTVASGAALTVGNWYLLGSTSPFGASAISTSHDQIRYKGELVRVESIASNTVTLTGFVRDNYTTSAGASLRPITFASGIGLRDLSVVNPAPLTSQASMVILTYVERFLVQNVSFEGGDGAGIFLDMCRDGVVQDCDFRDLADDVTNGRYGYGVVFTRATEGVSLANCTFRKLRHALTTNGVDGFRGVPRNITISGCTAQETTNAAYDTHAQGAGILFTGCHAENVKGYPAFHIRSQDTRVIGCSVSWALTGCHLGREADGAEVRGCTFRNLIAVGGSDGYGVQVIGPRQVMVADNSITQAQNNGIHIYTSSPGWIKVPNGTASTTLAAGINSSQVTITVASATGFPSSGNYRITIDSEEMEVTSGQGTTTWTVTRAVNGTTGASHASGAAITDYQLLPADQNPANCQIIGNSITNVGSNSASTGLTNRIGISMGNTDPITGLRVVDNHFQTFSTSSDEPGSTGSMAYAIFFGASATGCFAVNNTSSGHVTSLLLNNGGAANKSSGNVDLNAL